MEGTLLNPNPQVFGHLHRKINTTYFVTIVNCQSGLTTVTALLRAVQIRKERS